MKPVPMPAAPLERVQRWGLPAGLALLAVCSATGFLRPDEFFRSCLVGFLFWSGLSLGSLVFLMIHHLSGGQWGAVIRRPLEAAARNLPLTLLYFLPVALGMKRLFPWARPEVMASDPLLQEKALYLNVPFFLARAALYWAVWLVLVRIVLRWSRRQDRAGSDPDLVTRLQAASGAGLVAYGVTITFASVDWVMSLEPHWFSTAFGMLFGVGQALEGLAFAVLTLRLFAGRDALERVLRPKVMRDLGNLLLASVMVWTYIAFVQYLITWAGNLPEEIGWFLHRARGGWSWVAVSLLAFHFFVPFLLLLSRQVKHRVRVLSMVAGGLFAMRFVDMLWLVVPSFHPGRFSIGWLDLAVPAGMGGIWAALYARRLRLKPALPEHDPQLEALLEDHDGTA